MVVQVTLIASWAWLWLLLWNSALNQPVVLQSAAVIGIACFSGLISRLILRGQAALLRWLCALLSALASLVGTFLLTRGSGWLSTPAGCFSIHQLEWISAGADGGLHHLDRVIRQLEKTTGNRIQ